MRDVPASPRRAHAPDPAPGPASVGCAHRGRSVLYRVFATAVVALAAIGCAGEPEPRTTGASDPTEQVEPTVPAVEFTRDRIVAVEFPVEVRIVDPSGERPSLEISDESGTVVRDIGLAGGVLYSIHADGLVAGERYKLALSVGGEIADTMELVVAVDMAPPTPIFPPNGYQTIDPRQPIEWSPVDGAAAYVVEIETPVATRKRVVAGAAVPLFDASPVYGEARWRIRWSRPDGLRSPASEFRTLLVTRTPDTRRIPSDAAELWSTTGFVTISGMNGAVTGELSIETVDGAPAVQGPLVVPGRRSSGADDKSPTDKLVFRLAGLNDGAEHRYRYRGRPEAGEWTEWSEWSRFTVRDLGVRFIPIVVDQPVLFTMGYDQGFDDEAPAHQVRITRPYAVADAPLTNEQVSVAVNALIDEGEARIEGEVVLAGDGAIVRLGELDYGTQFGLVAVEERLSPATGRALHPAIGLTWNGAVALANLFSARLGLPAAYGPEDDWRRWAPSVRLPTEAEWALAARGETDTPFPWGSEIGRRRVNYYRSFDPFEDVDFPFTRSGGPTTPVRYFDGSIRSGFQTQPNRSPYGVWDVAGNVWEWCWDWYDRNLFEDRLEDVPGAIDPIGPEEGEFRVVRGCAWNTRTPDVRVTNRGRFAPDGGSFSIGLRLALDTPYYEETP